MENFCLAGALRRLQHRDLEVPLVSPPPRRLSNASRRRRKYLTPDEVEKLLQAAGKLGRHGARDRTLVLLAYRHGLRVSELVAPRWDQVYLKTGLLHVARLKNGVASTHPIRELERREPRALWRDYRKLALPIRVRVELAKSVNGPQNCQALSEHAC